MKSILLLLLLLLCTAFALPSCSRKNAGLAAADPLLGEWEIIRISGRKPTLAFPGWMGVNYSHEFAGSTLVVEREQMTWKLKLPADAQGFLIWGGGGDLSQQGPDKGLLVQSTPITTDTKATPARITSISSFQDKKHIKLQGIYKLEGDSLTMVRAAGESENPPAGFDVPDGDFQNTLIKARRKVPAGAPK
jgi:uncharacterized protein (TIGR03067 family)